MTFSDAANFSAKPIKIPTPLDVAGMRAERFEPVINEQIELIVTAMTSGRSTCHALAVNDFFQAAIRERLHDAGWAVRFVSDRSTEVSWSPLPPGDPCRVVAENASDVVLALARLLCEAYGEHLGWRSTASDAHELRRWTCRSDGPEYPGHPYAMDDGSSAGENERAAWIAAARALFDSERT